MSLSITPQLIIEAAKHRGWKVSIIDEIRSFYRLDIPDGRYFYVRNITSKKSYTVNTVISDRKDLFHRFMTTIGVRVPDTLEYRGEDLAAAKAFLQKHKQVVVKPIDQSHGNGVTTNVQDEAALEDAIAFAGKYGSKMLIQQQVVGDDYRVLMIDGKLAAAAIRKPAFVIGDGVHAITELIELENNSDRRGQGYSNKLTQINVAAATRYLGKKMQAVPAKDVEIQVVGTANVGKGGVSLDVTDTVDPRLVEIARTVTDHLDMGLCGVDFLVTADGVPYMIEINSGPSLGLHEYPFKGKARNTPDLFLDWLVK